MDENLIPKDITKRIEEYERNLTRWTYYELLYITRDADEESIKKAYRKLVQLMHPDRYGLDLEPEKKTTLEKIFNEINIAYNILLDKSQRMKYDQSLYDAEDHGTPIREDSDVMIAKAQYSRGIEALKKGEIVPAIEFFKSAISLSPGISEYHAKLAYALSKHSNPRVKKDSFAACKEAIKLDQENPNYHALMGYLYQVTGDIYTAEVHYRRALTWDPRHPRSREELKKIIKLKEDDKKAQSVVVRAQFFVKEKMELLKQKMQKKRRAKRKNWKKSPRQKTDSQSPDSDDLF